jgi:hypothetical protein
MQPTRADFKLAAELLRAGGDPSGPTHFLSPGLLDAPTTEQLANPTLLPSRKAIDWFPGLGPRIVPDWARQYPRFPCAGCRPDKVVLYRQPGRGRVY